MNPYAILILAALLLEHALSLAADLANLRALDPRLPEEMRGLHDEASYRRSQEYTRERTRFGMLRGSVSLVVLLCFWWLGGFGWLDDLVRGLGWSAVPTGLAYISALLLAARLVALPFDLWATFVIEERYGFNRTRPATFVADLAKGLLLAALLGLPLLAGLLYLFERAGSSAWLWCWALTTAFVLFAQFLAPTWILPLFNRFTPLAEGELRDAILGYARSVGFPLEGIFVIDGSKRSTKANAYFTGFGRHKRIALFDTLIQKQSTEELLAVVAHEIGHYKRRHILKGLAIGIAHFGLLFALLGFFLENEWLFAAFGLRQTSVWGSFVFFGLLYTPVELVLSILMQAFSRKNEYEADAFAARTTGRAEALVSALKKLAAENLSNLTPHPFYVVLHHSHPPLFERIAALRRHGAPVGGLAPRA